MKSSVLVAHGSRSPMGAGESFLKLQLMPDVYCLVMMKQVQEVMVLPAERLTPMPNLPSPVLGLFSRRSRVLWVADLPQILGVGVLEPTIQQYSVAIAQVGTRTMGLAVQQIESMGWLSPEHIQPPPSQVPTALVPYLRGCVVQDQQVLLVLNVERVLHAPCLQPA